RLFFDSDCDVDLKTAKEYGAELISMPYTVDGKLICPYEDYEEFDYNEFYGMLRDRAAQGGELPTTSSVNAERYKQYFEPFFAQGDEILYVHFSESMSQTFENMRAAVAELKEKYPDAVFREFDTKAITTLGYTLSREAGELYKAGKTADEIIAHLNKEINHYTIYFFADNLKFFKRSGRVGGLAATMGTLLGVRPIIYISEEGKMESIGKERGRFNALERLLTYVEELGDDIRAHRLVVAHTGADEIADQLIEAIKERFGADLEVEKVVVNPTAGAHCGPDSVGICFHSKRR
ncbi:MAG: DegV family protein, partial [Clostridia bacterium]|nr:DegV family protein [Clostridia bacterium]